MSQFRPINPLLSPRFGDIATFNRLPYLPELFIQPPKDPKVDVAIIGVPFDGGTSFRPGARFGPRAIREASVLCRNFHPQLGVDVYSRLNVVDGGDIPVNPIQIQGTFDQIQKHLAHLHAHEIKTILVGGDHSILLPDLRMIHKKYGKFTLVHFDAHTDTGDTAWGEKYHHGTPIRRAIEEGLIAGDSIFQIGIRGPLGSPQQDAYLVEQKINVLDIDLFQDSAQRKAFFTKILKTAGNHPVYLTFDIDSVDPAFAPGTGTPVVGGLTSYQAIQSVRELKGLNLVGANLVEVAPAYDHAEVTSLLGAALVFEFLALMAFAKKLDQSK